jgi:hypothetical protein
MPLLNAIDYQHISQAFKEKSILTDVTGIKDAQLK